MLRGFPWTRDYNDKLEFVRVALFTGKITIDMTKREFDKLKVGDFIVNKEGENFKVDMDYVFGPPVQVLSATLQGGEREQSIRISEGNFQFYERIFPY